MSYQAFVCKLQNVRPHSNADKIKLATVYGGQIVVGLEQQDGELGVYFPTDGQLSTEFCSNNNLFRHSELNIDKEIRGYFEDNRRIRTQKFRERNPMDSGCLSPAWTSLGPHVNSRKVKVLIPSVTQKYAKNI